MYRSGCTLKKIANYLRSKGMVGRYLHNSVGYAIRGHNGELGLKPYGGLIDPEEQAEITRDHHTAAAMINKNNKKGIHGRDREKRIEDARNAGLIGGRVTVSRGGGFSRNKLEALTEISNKGVLARGKVPWNGSYSKATGMYEEEYLIELSKDPDYINSNNTFKCTKIANELNLKYHCGEKVRTMNAVNIRLKKLRDKK
jgi:hypothetical protein